MITDDTKIIPPASIQRKIAMTDDLSHVIKIQLIMHGYAKGFALDLNIIVDNALQNKP
ncbi:hypothetical protein [Paenibacillus pabuli]|uniref:hypothetical protein n=1 Tax=Paenibacillus pabuli TaxID=1472 RepID=UPI001FFE478B|nr:hypothetical protein [Paenibacillus pabuli]UPK47677.1 hypothetical protein KET34_20865 [Paenibacillus pabuli]